MTNGCVTMIVFKFQMFLWFWQLCLLILEIISYFPLKVHYFTTLFLFHINFFGSVSFSSQLIIEPSIFDICDFYFSSFLHFVNHYLSCPFFSPSCHYHYLECPTESLSLFSIFYAAYEFIYLTEFLLNHFFHTIFFTLIVVVFFISILVLINLIKFISSLYRMLPPPLKKKKVEEIPNDIPDVLQGEIARLDQRFKVCTTCFLISTPVLLCNVKKT